MATCMNGWTYSVQVIALFPTPSFSAASLWERRGGQTPVPFDLPSGSLPPPQAGQVLLLTLKGERAEEGNDQGTGPSTPTF